MRTNKLLMVKMFLNVGAVLLFLSLTFYFLMGMANAVISERDDQIKIMNKHNDSLVYQMELTKLRNDSLQRQNMTLLAYKKIAESKLDREDFFIWDATTNRAYYGFPMSPKKLKTTYDIGKEYNLDLNEWMYYPYLETTYGTSWNKTRYDVSDSNHTYYKSTANAIGLSGIMPLTGKDYLEKNLGYSNLSYRETIKLLYVDSINVRIGALYCVEHGLDRETYIFGPTYMKKKRKG